MIEFKQANWVLRGQLLITAIAVIGLLWIAASAFFKTPLPSASLNIRTLPAGCPQMLTGQPGRHNDLMTPGGLRYSVIAPVNYQPNLQYGLLMVYPPAGFSNTAAERYYQLTTKANTQGFIAVYSTAIPLSEQALRLQREVVPHVMSQWCIDPHRVVSLGHSDGGSVTTGLTVRQAVTPPPTHIVSSAAGITAEDLKQEACPAPLNVTVLHNPKDKLFPDYGAGAVKWWAQCMQCSVQVETEATGCIRRQCAREKILRHCATTEPHSQWPVVTQHLFEWID